MGARLDVQALLEEQESDSFDDLVREYAAMGYSEYATARRLLGIDVRTMRAHLSEPVNFKRYSSQWQDYSDTAAKVRAARKRNGTLRLITHDGETLHLKAWSRKTGIAATTISHRIDKYGWPIDKALTVKMGSRAAHNPHKQKPTAAQRLDLSNPNRAR